MDRAGIGNNTFFCHPKRLRRSGIGGPLRHAYPDGKPPEACVERHIEDVSAGIGPCATPPYSRLDPVDHLFNKAEAIDLIVWISEDERECRLAL